MEDMKAARETRSVKDMAQRKAAAIVFDQEGERQQEEEPKLEKAFFHHTAKLQEEWDKKLEVRHTPLSSLQRLRGGCAGRWLASRAGPLTDAPDGCAPVSAQDFDEWVLGKRHKFGLELDADKQRLQHELDTTLRQRRSATHSHPPCPSFSPTCRQQCLC